MSESFIRQVADGVVLNVKITPNASKSSIEGVLGDRMKIKIAAKPEDGKANKEVIEFLAKTLCVKKSDVEIVKGITSREKSVLVKTEKSLVIGLLSSLQK